VARRPGPDRLHLPGSPPSTRRTGRTRHRAARTSRQLGDGADLLEATRENQLEGIVAKRIDSLYRPGARSPMWRKVASGPTKASSATRATSPPRTTKSPGPLSARPDSRARRPVTSSTRAGSGTSVAPTHVVAVEPGGAGTARRHRRRARRERRGDAG
jgi:hypothetical protein